MPVNSPIRQRIAEIVKEVLAEVQLSAQKVDPESGTVTAVNDDGSVNVTTTSGSNYTNVGTPIVMTIGTLVSVITADGLKVAVPRGTQVAT